MVNTLYPYQLEDVAELKLRPRIILGSVMRAGKMVETFELVRQLDLHNVLIICPKPIIDEWYYKCIEWLGYEYICRFDMINYEQLRDTGVVGQIQKHRYDLIVMDEAHRVKNRRAQQTQGAMLIAQFAPRLILATGTPYENNASNLWTLFKMVDSSFMSYTAFVEHFCQMVRLPKPPFPTIISGTKNKQELRELLAKYMLRREKYELVNHEGRPVVLDREPIRTIPVHLTPDQMSKYASMEQELFTLLDSGERITSPAAIAKLTRLRQICLEPNIMSSDPIARISSPSAKTSVIIDLLEDADGPLVIFTYYDRYAQILDAELTKHKVSHAIMSGTVADEARYAARQGFQAGKYQALVATIKTGGLGIPLTAAHTVVFTDLFWNPQVNDQAISRLEGTGQTRPVQVIDLWAIGTVEDHMHRVVGRKERDFKDIVVKDGSGLAIMTSAIESMRQARISELRSMRNVQH